MNNVIAKR